MNKTVNISPIESNWKNLFRFSEISLRIVFFIKFNWWIAFPICILYKYNSSIQIKMKTTPKGFGLRKRENKSRPCAH